MMKNGKRMTILKGDKSMEIFARDLKVGDKVNCHEDGWLIVTKIKESFILNVVTFENGKEKYYNLGDRVFVVRQ